MDTTTIYEDSVSELIKLCRDTFGDRVKAYYEGDPVEIPNVNLPAIIVEKMNGTISLTDAPTGFDRFHESISIRLLLDKTNDLGASDDVDLTERKLRNAVEGRDPATGSYRVGTLMHALRTNITLLSLVFNSDISISYDINPRPNQVVTSEAEIILSDSGLTLVNGRN